MEVPGDHQDPACPARRAVACDGSDSRESIRVTLRWPGAPYSRPEQVLSCAADDVGGAVTAAFAVPCAGGGVGHAEEVGQHLPDCGGSCGGCAAMSAASPAPPHRSGVVVGALHHSLPLPVGSCHGHWPQPGRPERTHLPQQYIGCGDRFGSGRDRELVVLKFGGIVAPYRITPSISTSRPQPRSRPNLCGAFVAAAQLFGVLVGGHPLRPRCGGRATDGVHCSSWACLVRFRHRHPRQPEPATS